MLSDKRVEKIVSEAKAKLKEFKKNPTQKAVLNWNAFVRGTQNYFKGMTHFNKSFKKIQWRIYKLFRHVMSRTAKTYKKDNNDDAYLRQQLDDWGYKTWGHEGFYYLHGFPILQLDWANWDKNLCRFTKQKVIRTNPYDYGDKNHKSGVSDNDIEHLVQTSQTIKRVTMKYRDFRVSKYSCLKGVSYITGEKVAVDKYFCHHIIPRNKGGTDDWNNLCILSKAEHKLLHSPNYMLLLEDARTPKFKKRLIDLISKVHDITIK